MEKELQEYQKWCEEKGLNPLDEKVLRNYKESLREKPIKFGELVKEFNDVDIPGYLADEFKETIKEMVAVTDFASKFKKF